MLAKNVEIVRKSCRGEGRRSQSVPCVAGRVERIVARLQERTPGGIAVGLGGGGDVLPKQRREVTLVGVATPSGDLVEGDRGLRQQVLRTLHPARNHILVRRLPGGALEQARKVSRAHLRHNGELG